MKSNRAILLSILTVCLLGSLLALPAGSYAQTRDSDDERFLTSGEVVEGAINTISDTDRYYFNATAGTTAALSMVGGDRLDAYLILVAPDSSWVQTDNNSGVGTSAYMEVSLQQSGTYTIIARNNNSLSIGSYQLAVYLNIGPVSDDPDDGRWLNTNDVQGGTIGIPSDLDALYFSGRAGMEVYLRAVGFEGLDTYLVLFAPDGTPLAENDNTEYGSNAVVTAFLPQDGTYRVQVRSAPSQTVGSYELYINLEPDGVPDELSEGRWLGVGSAFDGSIEQFVDEDPFFFRARAATQVQIYMAGFDQLDSYLILIGPDGRWIATDNDSGADSDATLRATLTQNGIYTILARNFGGDTTGRYVLSLIQY